MPSPTTALSDQRIADPARVAPYLTHVIRHHGQLTLIPPDNAGRIRKPKREKREKAERRAARAALNDEPHFNTGVSRTARRGPPASPASRARRQDRRPNAGEGDMYIPDYPPPSFDEAISTGSTLALPLPGAAAPPATTSLDTVSSTAQRSASPSPASDHPSSGPEQSTHVLPRTRSRLTFATPVPELSTPSTSSDPRYSTQAEYNSSDGDSDSNPDTASDSDIGSLEFVSTSEVPAGANQWEQDRLQGLTLQERLARERERQQTRHAVSDVASSIARALRPSRSQLTIVPTKHTSDRQLDTHDEPPLSSASASSPSTESPHARNASPSPVRTGKRRLPLFLGSGAKDKDRQPASLPSSPTFASSQLSLPFLALSHPSSPGAKGQSSSFVGRRFFGHKGKEKEKERRVETPPSREARSAEKLEDWEVLDQTYVSASPHVGRRDSPPSPDCRLQPWPDCRLQPPPSPSASSILLNGAQAVPRPKRHSLLDRPAPPPPPASFERARAKPPPPPLPAPGTAAPTVVGIACGSGARQPSPTRSVQFQNEEMTRPQPLRELKPSSSMVYLRDREVHAPPPPTVVPVPVSPTSTRSGATHLDYTTPTTPTSPQFFIGADGVLRRGTPVPAALLSAPHHGPAPAPREAEPAVPVAPGPRHRHFVPPTPSPLASRDDASQLEPYGHAPVSAAAGPSAIPAVPASPTLSAITEASGERADAGGAPSASSRHHYPGRPLPQPPSPNASPARHDSVSAQRVLDETAAVGDGFDTGAGHIRPRAVGVEAYAASLPPSPPIQSTMPPPPISSPAPSPRARTPPATSLLRADLDGAGAGPPTPSVYEDTGTDARAGPDGRFSQYTDLDVLLSRLEEDHGGDNYENLLLLADIMGPAATPAQAPPAPRIGAVAVVRRRVMRDGRVKLKLSLLGASVDRCGICMSQFREAQAGARGPACGHAFHERCLRSWFARGSRACPLCRAQFD